MMVRRSGKVDCDGGSEQRMVRIVLAVAIVLNFVMLLPFMDGICSLSGDGAAHYASAQAIVFNIESGKGFFGNWNPMWASGFPAYDYYQYLPHLFMALLHFISFKLIPVLSIQKMLTVLAVSLFPLSLFYGLTRLRLPRLPAAFASLFAFALSSSVGHGGIGYSLVHHGVFTQTLGVVLFPIALARVYVTVQEHRSYFLSVFFLSLTLLTQPIVGYALCIASVVFLFVDVRVKGVRDVVVRAGHLAIIVGLAFLVTSHFFVPFLMGQEYYGTPFYTASEDYYQGGAGQVISDFVTGRTLDFFRSPFVLLTLFFAVGVFGAVRLKRFPRIIAGGGFVLFFLLMFGRPVWGALFDLIPGMKYMLVFRMMFALQFFALFFVGTGFTFIFMNVRRRTGKFSPVLVMLVLLLLIGAPLFLPVIMTNKELCSMSKSEMQEYDFSSLVAHLREADDGRFMARPELGFKQPYFEMLLPIYTSHDSFSTSSMGSQDNLAYYYTQYFGLPSPSAYDLFNVRYVLVPSDRDKPYGFYRRDFVSGNYTLYSVDTSGFFDLVDSTMVYIYRGSMGDPDVRTVNSAWLNSRSMEAGDYITLVSEDEYVDDGSYRVINRYEGADFGVYADMFNSEGGRDVPSCGGVLGEDRGLGHFTATVLTNRSCLLLFKMSYHPAWYAQVNGMPEEVHAVSPAFMAVDLDEGLWQVDWMYAPDNALRYWLLALGLVVLLGVMVWDLVVFWSTRQR